MREGVKKFIIFSQGYSYEYERDMDVNVNMDVDVNVNVNVVRVLWQHVAQIKIISAQR